MPGPQAGTAQGRGVPQFQQGEAGEGALSLDLSALGQCQKETWRKRTQKTEMTGDQQPVAETREKVEMNREGEQRPRPGGTPVEVLEAPRCQVPKSTAGYRSPVTVTGD